MEALRLTRKDDHVLVEVHVVPRASKSAVQGVHDGRLKVSLDAPPVDGAANAAHVDPIADDGSDSIAAHLAGRISNDPDVVIEHDSEPAVRHDLVDDTFDGEKFFLGHGYPIPIRRHALDRALRG